MYKSVVFDIDGTLIDTRWVALTGLQRALLEVEGRHLTLDQLDFAFGIPSVETLEQLSVKDPSGCAEHWERAYAELFPHARLFDGVLETVERLHAMGVRLGVVTSKDAKEMEEDYRLLDFSRYFDCIVCADATKRHKPDPEPMRCYLTRSGMAPGDTLYVGDTVYDIQCGSGAGVDTALALWGARGVRDIPATYHLKRPEQLLALGNREEKRA